MASSSHFNCFQTIHGVLGFLSHEAIALLVHHWISHAHFCCSGGMAKNEGPLRDPSISLRPRPLLTSRRSRWCLLLSSSDLMRSRRAVPRSSSSSATVAVRVTSRSRAWLNSKFCFSRSSCSSSTWPVSSSRDRELSVSHQAPPPCPALGRGAEGQHIQSRPQLCPSSRAHVPGTPFVL